ncbi:MAG: DUF1997 domain-containing protein [Leptolyngbyaceae cyanobacterium T60_A2020_046]|nr:DUF1997 domain-containing protein [Leptolyngbyaceae cyanobacterium T60_A2020_046]
MLRLAASQSVTIQVRENSVPISHYLRQPQRLVYALMPQKQVEVLGSNQFRLRLRAFQFFMVQIQPVVDLQVCVNDAGHVTLQSTGCQIDGNEFINQRFELDLSGFLFPKQVKGQTQLVGKADLAIAVELPALFKFTPHSLLESSGNQLLKGVLLTIKQRLMRQLLTDYQQWGLEHRQGVTLPLGGDRLRLATSKASCDP